MSECANVRVRVGGRGEREDEQAGRTRERKRDSRHVGTITYQSGIYMHTTIDTIHTLLYCRLKCAARSGSLTLSGSIRVTVLSPLRRTDCTLVHQRIIVTATTIHSLHSDPRTVQVPAVEYFFTRNTNGFEAINTALHATQSIAFFFFFFSLSPCS